MFCRYFIAMTMACFRSPCGGGVSDLLAKETGLTGQSGFPVL
jgi:hypothetical protein